MNYQEKIEACLREHNGMITSAYCKKQGIPTIYLTRMVRDGSLIRVAAGLYIMPDSSYDELFIFQYQFKKTVFSYETALFLLGKTDRIPEIIEVTVASSYRFNQLPPKVHVNFVIPEILDLGVVSVQTMYGNTVRAYGYERVLCDLIAHKEKADAETYVKAIQGYARYPGKNVHLLREISGKMGISKQVREIMEVAYE